MTTSSIAEKATANCGRRHAGRWAFGLWLALASSSPSNFRSAA
jgi:hypothetical protein